jgi:hypothetical protein
MNKTGILVDMFEVKGTIWLTFWSAQKKQRWSASFKASPSVTDQFMLGGEYVCEVVNLSDPKHAVLKEVPGTRSVRRNTRLRIRSTLQKLRIWLPSTKRKRLALVDSDGKSIKKTSAKAYSTDYKRAHGGVVQEIQFED